MQKKKLAFFLIALLVFGGSVFALWIKDMKLVGTLHSSYPRINYLRDSQKKFNIQVDFDSRPPQGWVSINVIPRSVYGAVIVSEDWAFFDHNGFDWNQIKSAFREWRGGRSRIRGASTLSQQLVKNVFLSQDRSWLRKFREAILTYHLESQFSKNQILEIYLNIVEWGPGVVGIGQASNYFFSKSVTELNPREAAFLAFLLPNPIVYSKSFKERRLGEFAVRRVDSVMQRMLQAQMIDQDTWYSFYRQPLSFEEVPYVESDMDVDEDQDEYEYESNDSL